MKMFCTHYRYIGRQIGDYRITKYIGEGRYGVCFLAEGHGEKVILKKFKSGIFRRNRVKNDHEIQILSEICHPGIPKLLGIVNEQDFYGLVLERIMGETLETILFQQKHRFSEQEIFTVGVQLIDIIGYLHEKGIVHRDIRLPNVMMKDGKVMLVDFGLARYEEAGRYPGDTDFSYLGDLLLYLLYSSYQKEGRQSGPWYRELSLSDEKRLFLQGLLRLETPYQQIHEVKNDFHKAFRIPNVEREIYK